MKFTDPLPVRLCEALEYLCDIAGLPLGRACIDQLVYDSLFADQTAVMHDQDALDQAERALLDALDYAAVKVLGRVPFYDDAPCRAAYLEVAEILSCLMAKLSAQAEGLMVYKRMTGRHEASLFGLRVEIINQYWPWGSRA